MGEFLGLFMRMHPAHAPSAEYKSCMQGRRADLLLAEQACRVCKEAPQATSCIGGGALRSIKPLHALRAAMK